VGHSLNWHKALELGALMPYNTLIHTDFLPDGETLNSLTWQVIICPKTQIHYLDAISGDGEHNVAEMSPHAEKCLVFISSWKSFGCQVV
jgi:hypothetical protein